MPQVVLAVLAALGLVLGAPHAALAQAQDFELPVDVELILAVDVSGSMDRDEHQVQRQGYAAALRHPDFVKAVQAGGFQRVAITYVEWAGPGRQAVVLPWTAITGEAEALAVADHLAGSPVNFMRGTSISDALDYVLPLFDDNGFEGARRVIDVSGDGPNNMGPPIVPARDRVLAAGVTINGLPIMIRPSMRGAPAGYGLDSYYRDCVIGGPGAFVLPVRDASGMAEAIRQKLILDIAQGSPEMPGRVIRA
jgi:hypothetical protein